MANGTRTSTSEPRKRSAANKTALPNNSQAKLVSRSALAIALFLLAVLLAKDFLSAIGWAVIIAVTTWPIYLRFKRIFGSGRDSAPPALIFAIAAGAVILVPIALAAHQAGQESFAIEQSLQHYRKNGIPMPTWISQVPSVGEPATRWWQANLSDPGRVGDWIGTAGNTETVAMTPGLGVEIMHRLFLILVSLIVLYSFLRHGSWVANRCLETADRLLGLPGERLASKMVDAIRGTVNGTVTVAVVEGVLNGAAYFVAGVPNPLLFTLLTMAFAMVPFGAWAVFGWANSRRRRVDRRRIVPVRCRNHAHRRHVLLAHVGRRGSAAAIPGGVHRNLWRVKSLRPTRAISGAGDHGGALRHLA